MIKRKISVKFKAVVSVALTAMIIFSSAETAFAFNKNVVDLLNNDEFGKAVSQFIKKNKSDDNSKRVVGKANDEIDFSSYGADEIITAEDGRFMLTFESVKDAEACADKLADNSGVLYAQTDDSIEISAYESKGTKPISWGTSAIQTDELASLLQDIDFDRTVTVAVVDSGASDIDYLEDRLVNGYDFVDNDKDPSNDTSPYSHGTFISSIIVDNTCELPVNIMPVRVIEYEEATLSNISNGVYYAVDHGADVINLSLGGMIASCKIIDDAVEYAISKNVAVVVAAGNESDNTTFYCPAHITSAITVSAIDSELNFDESYSNYGSEVDFAAPGTNIKGYGADGKRTILDGTSMSTGFVSACMGILKLLYPNASIQKLEAVLADSAYNPDGVEKNKYYGYGVPQMMFFAGYTNGDVYLAPEKKNVILNETYSFNSYNLSDLSPAENLQWTSSNEEIARIDSNGTVTPLKAGTTEITCISNEKVSKCLVSVKEIKDIYVSQEPQYIYYVYKKGQFDPSGIEITVEYTDETTDIVYDCSKLYFEGFNANESGTQSIKVQYFDAETSFDIYVGYTFWQLIIRFLLFGWIWY